jgi:Ni,Fe-hydrogenase III small subunit/formate hydrogenlyase subunit 6/NADH:ubiquinone oxidoreductase subunit I
MFDVLLARWKQGHRTMRYPAGPPPELPERFVGRPTLDASKCKGQCRQCVAVCPTGAIGFGQSGHSIQLDTGRCLFCRQCETACAAGAIAFTRDYQMAASQRDDLIVRNATQQAEEKETGPICAKHPAGRSGELDLSPFPRRAVVALDDASRRLFGRSLKLRQVSAGGCNACEADTNVLGTVAWDLGRFGIQFVASPRHADGLLITGPVPENMRLALQKTYEAVPWPKLVIAVGTCAISGGPYVDHPEVHNGAATLLPVDLFVPGCPPHPITILHALLELLQKVISNPSTSTAECSKTPDTRRPDRFSCPLDTYGQNS